MLPDTSVLAKKVTAVDIKQKLRWFLKTTVRILIVTDTNITLDGQGFGLSKVIDTLEAQDFYHNARFVITGATRQGPPSVDANATSHQFKFRGFRFGMGGFNINDYDQIWFFGFAPGNDANASDAGIDTAPTALTDAAEIAILSDWMNAGRGGVLAMGDHHYLGASLCHNIPRVRKMRRWTNADLVPSISGSDRKDTNQANPATAGVPFNAQSDEIPQPIEVLKRRYQENIFRTKALPHPILCGADGPITVLPDHPHEGEVLGVRYDSGTGLAVNLDGDYPVGTLEFPNHLSGVKKPRPEIIALGHPHNFPDHEKNSPSNTLNPSHTNDTSPFGLVNVYDGSEAGVGRIVTDSTWHHWLNVNLLGLESTPDYVRIQNFFTNVAVWLCREELRQSMLSTWVWDFAVSEFDPMRFSIHDSIWRLGIAARDVLGRKASQCTGIEWTFDHIILLRQKFKLPDLTGPCLTCPPWEVFEIAILGGIMKEIVPLVESYRLLEHHERKLINTKEIGEAVRRGIENGHNEMLKTFKESLAKTEALFRVASKALQLPEAKRYEPKLAKANLRIELESILFNTPVLARLAAAKGSFVSVAVSNQFMRINKTPLTVKLKAGVKTASNAFLHSKIKQAILEETFQDGETLKIEFFLNSKTMSPESKIYELELDGSVETWAGSHHPSAQGSAPVAVWLNISRKGK
jgi:hypothetical protein